jgi:hypothetical protein
LADLKAMLHFRYRPSAIDQRPTYLQETKNHSIIL